MPKQRADSTQTTSEWHRYSNLIRNPQKTLILCVVSALDVIMTHYLLTRGDLRFTESNPVARFFLHHWGLAGMAYFKAFMTFVVCVITQIVARKNSTLARQVLSLSTVIIVTVVIYSVWLHFKHHQITQVIEMGQLDVWSVQCSSASKIRCWI